jgi:hypothetical protein
VLALRRRLQRARAAYDGAMARYAAAMHEYQRLLLQDGFVAAAQRAEFDRALAWLGADKPAVAAQQQPRTGVVEAAVAAVAAAAGKVAGDAAANNELEPISPPEPPVIGRTESEQKLLDGARNVKASFPEHHSHDFISLKRFST